MLEHHLVIQIDIYANDYNRFIAPKPNLSDKAPPLMARGSNSGVNPCTLQLTLINRD